MPIKRHHHAASVESFGSFAHLSDYGPMPKVHTVICANGYDGSHIAESVLDRSAGRINDRFHAWSR
jgi:hypothetical protein